MVAGGTTSIPLVSNFPANAPTSGLSFLLLIGANFALDYMITAAESKGVGKLLSSPQLVTQNNAKAVVKQGAQIPIQTTINNTISVQYVDAVLRLQVTPQITADGTVFLDVLVENTQIDNGIPGQRHPRADTQSAQTKVLINDGGTVVIGGVMVTQQQTNIQQVPLVGSIPLIGHLFKRTAVSVSIAGVALLRHAADSAGLAARAGSRGLGRRLRSPPFFMFMDTRYRPNRLDAGADATMAACRRRCAGHHAPAQRVLSCAASPAATPPCCVLPDSAAPVHRQPLHDAGARGSARRPRPHRSQGRCRRQAGTFLRAKTRRSRLRVGFEPAHLNLQRMAAPEEGRQARACAGNQLPAWSRVCARSRAAAELDAMRHAAKLGSEVMAEVIALITPGRQRTGPGRRNRLTACGERGFRVLL